jgi:hypothetical protein
MLGTRSSDAALSKQSGLGGVPPSTLFLVFSRLSNAVCWRWRIHWCVFRVGRYPTSDEKMTRRWASQGVVPVPGVAGLTHAKHRKNRLKSCGMSWIEGWITGNELLLAWLVISSPFAVLVGLFIKSGSWK